MIPDVLERMEMREALPGISEQQAVLTVRKAMGAELRGYSAFPPSQEAREIDSSVAAEARCGRCGAVGLAFAGFTLWADFTRDDGWESYRAFAVCPVCHDIREF